MDNEYVEEESSEAGEVIPSTTAATAIAAFVRHLYSDVSVSSSECAAFTRHVEVCGGVLMQGGKMTPLLSSLTVSHLHTDIDTTRSDDHGAALADFTNALRRQQHLHSFRKHRRLSTERRCICNSSTVNSCAKK